MQTWQNNKKNNKRIQNLVNQRIQNLVNQRIQSSLRRCVLHMAVYLYGQGLNCSIGQWEGNKNQVSTLHHVLMFHHVIVKLDEYMTLWGEPEQVHVKNMV